MFDDPTLEELASDEASDGEAEAGVQTTVETLTSLLSLQEILLHLARVIAENKFLNLISAEMISGRAQKNYIPLNTKYLLDSVMILGGQRGL